MAETPETDKLAKRDPDAPQADPIVSRSTSAILLISGATPAVHSRLSWLDDFLPLPVIEISHFLGSLVGTALLFLAIGLQQGGHLLLTSGRTGVFGLRFGLALVVVECLGVRHQP